jgi:FMN-dependent NADH-azoreductase
MKLLHIDSSITGDKSISRQLTADIVEKLTDEQPDLDVTYYNLDSKPFAYLSSHAFNSEAEQQEGQRALKDFKEADIVVIGAPMYNFAVPAQLKAWIDRVAVAGETFHYTENGPEGLAGGKKVIIASVRGGVYSGDLSALDHQESYLKTVLGFMGITDVEIIRAEGVNMGPEVAAKAIENAKANILTLS